MQKTVSVFLLSLSLLLLFLTMTTDVKQQIQNLPPFYQTAPIQIPEEKNYIGKDFSITSQGKTPSAVHAKSYCLMDANSNRVLCGKEENKKMPMASTTKIMTCILALEYGDLDSEVKVSSYAASMPDVQLNMRSGDSFYLRDLLYSLMLESHNDTAVAIAEHIGKTVEGFAELMNKKAAELGCTNTNFVTPNGLDHKDHYTTAKELCMIAAYAVRNKDFLKIIQTKSHQFSNCKGNHSYTVRNHDAFLTNYSGAIGIKTGFTGKAGYCFCGAAKRNGQTLISSVLASGWPPNKSFKWADTKKLMNYGFSNFKQVTLETPSLPSSLPVTGGTKNTVSIQKETAGKTSYMLSENDTVSVRINLPKEISAPVRQGDIIGYEEYYLNNELQYRFRITAKESAGKRTKSYYVNLVRRLFFFCTAK